MSSGNSQTKKNAHRTGSDSSGPSTNRKQASDTRPDSSRKQHHTSSGTTAKDPKARSDDKPKDRARSTGKEPKNRHRDESPSFSDYEAELDKYNKEIGEVSNNQWRLEEKLEKLNYEMLKSFTAVMRLTTEMKSTIPKYISTTKNLMALTRSENEREILKERLEKYDKQFEMYEKHIGINVWKDSQSGDSGSSITGRQGSSKG